MGNNSAVTVLVLLAAAIVIISFGTARNAVLVAAKSGSRILSPDERAKLHQDLDNTIARINAEMDRLSTRAESGAGPKPDIERAIGKLQSMKSDLAQRLDRINGTAENKWRSFRQDAELAMERANIKLDKIGSDIKKETAN